MSTRQNKKRKGRNNVNNRERTVTTLTEDPNTPYLIPTPSEEPAGANLMSSPFSVASSSGANPNSSGFQIPSNFGFGFTNYIGPMHGNVHHQQHQQQAQQFFPQSSNLPPGQGDLEVLEKLKDMIKNGQHEFYRAVPQPAALANLYLGPANQSQVPHHPEQGGPQMSNNVLSASSPDISVQTADSLQFLQSNQVSVPQTPINRYSNSKTNNEGSPSTVIKSAHDSHHPLDSVAPPASAASDTVPPSQRSKFDLTVNTNGSRALGSQVSRHPLDSATPTASAASDTIPSSQRSKFDPAANSNGSRSLGGQVSRHPLDNATPTSAVSETIPSSQRPKLDPTANIIDIRALGGQTSTSPQQKHRDWERGRDRDRRPESRFRDDRSRVTDTRRPLPERHYERFHRYDSKPGTDELMPVDRRMDLPRPAASSDDRSARPILTDDRPVRLPTDDRPPPSRAPIPDAARSARVPPVDDRHPRPGPGEDRRGPSTEDRPNRPQPTTQEVAGRVTGEDRDGTRGGLHPASVAEDRNARPTAPLEDRSRPSLQDRMSQPPSSARADRKAPPNSVPDRGLRPGPPDERSHILGEPPRAPQDDRERVQPEERSGRQGPGERERYLRPSTPVPPLPLPRPTGYPRSASVARDDPRVIKNPPSPVRDFRAVREPSRERSDLRPGHRPENDRGFGIMDLETSPRPSDTPPRFADRTYTRRFSPPSAADIARDRARNFYSNSSPPRVAAEVTPYDVDSDRRYSSTIDRRDWPYPQQPRREWTQPEEDYWKSRRTYDRNGGAPIDRDRFDRDGAPPPVRSNGWETREERERRAFPGGGSSPPRSFDGAQRPLSARLTDGYPPPSPVPGLGPGPEDRPYPQPARDLERSRYPPTDPAPPPFSRVRQRSPSPIARRPALGPGGAVDDMRPPLKRAREEPPYRAGYYPPSPQAPPPLNRDRGSISVDYPARVVTPPPSGGSYYDSRSGPPPISGGSGNVSGPDERDYLGRDRGPGMDYGPGPSYDRPRSPPSSSRLPPTYGRRGYGRGGEPRDDRRYNMPPPPRTT